MQDRISKEEYLEWRDNRVTKQLIQDIYEKREFLKEGVVELSDESEKQRFVTIGRCQAMKDIIDFVLRDFDYEGKYETLETDSPQDFS